MTTPQEQSSVNRPEAINAARLPITAWAGSLRSLLLLVALPAALPAQYDFNTEAGAIRWYRGPGGHVTIPTQISNVPVTYIMARAFTPCTNLTSVTIPEGVTEINRLAFDCCNQLRGLHVAPRNSAYGSVDGVLLNKSQTALIRCPVAKAGSYAVPKTVTNVCALAFTYCTRLTNVAIPGSVTTIGYGAFESCSGLRSVTLAEGLSNIEDNAFAHCFSLAAVTIPKSVTHIGPGAFWSCRNLTGVYFQGNPPPLSSALFGEVSRATNYYLPGTVGWGRTFGGRPAILWRP